MTTTEDKVDNDRLPIRYIFKHVLIKTQKNTYKCDVT